jgi:pantoate--beta-alanine ligase
MGALHAGHRSLLERSRRENALSVLSVFVNPTQFNDPSDLTNYPRTWEADLALAGECGVDAVLAPDFAEMYPDDYRYKLGESRFSHELCGKHRPGHFDGVLSVVLKLLNLIRADRAYFGEKDYQQYLLIRDMARALFLETEIVPCPIVRDGDGLALSSRNVRLTPENRRRAANFPRILRNAATPDEARALLTREGFEVDYVEEFEGRRLAAIRAGAVRLIDNVEAPRHG